MAKLKVFRTAIGFHDAYVAAPSRKAALAAWGVDKDLFARGAAEVVDDPALTAEPLAQPGKVITRSRGSLAQQLRALGSAPNNRPRAAAPKPAAPQPKPARRPRKVPPRPSREPVEHLEREVAEEAARARIEQADLRRREQALAAERLALERSQRERSEALETKLAAARERYRAAVARWTERYAD